jgi:hypothetical protein
MPEYEGTIEVTFTADDDEEADCASPGVRELPRKREPGVGDRPKRRTDLGG